MMSQTEQKRTAEDNKQAIGTLLITVEDNASMNEMSKEALAVVTKFYEQEFPTVTTPCGMDTENPVKVHFVSALDEVFEFLGADGEPMDEMAGYSEVAIDVLGKKKDVVEFFLCWHKRKVLPNEIHLLEEDSKESEVKSE